MTPADRDGLLAHCMEAQALNAQQRRALCNSTAETDSALERIVTIHRDTKRALALLPADASDDLRDLLRDVLRHAHHAAEDVLTALAKNDAERNHIREVAGRIDRPVTPWSMRRVKRETRDHLANLGNPACSARSLEALRRIVADVPDEVLGTLDEPIDALGHLIGRDRYRRLLEIAAGQVPA